MRFSTPKRSHLVRLELTAMIDVVFLLIIFFMTTAQFVQRARASLELPVEVGEKESELATPPMVINILNEPYQPFVVGQNRIGRNELLELVDSELDRFLIGGGRIEDFEINIRADRSAASQVLNDLGAAFRDRGITRWRLSTQQP
ncbi:MAG: biopolymer transporter ExbD [Planctomycetes bacterium]|nr:biopolymer transporter ExbD [Planctomycetota bacterium]